MLLVTPLGLYNVLAAFQCLIDVIVAGPQMPLCLIYINDVIVLANTLNILTLQAVF